MTQQDPLTLTTVVAIAAVGAVAVAERLTTGRTDPVLVVALSSAITVLVGAMVARRNGRDRK